MNEFDILTTAADGMSAQQSAIGVFARNIALANAGAPGSAAVEPTFASSTTHTDDAEFARLIAGRSDESFDFASPPGDDDGEVLLGDGVDASARAPVVAVTGTHPRSGRADALGEMVAAMNAQRAFEANASVFELGKRLATRTIDAGSP